MQSFIRIIQSTRLYMLLFTLPYVLLLSTALGDATALLFVMAHCALVILFWTTTDQRAMQAGVMPAVPLMRNRDQWDLAIVERSRIVVGAALAIVLLLLIFVKPLLGVTGAVLAVGSLFIGSPLSDGARRWRMHMLELKWAFVALLIPLLLVRMIASSRGIVLPSHAVLATMLGAAMFAVFLLLCLLRDDPAIRGSGMRSTVSTLGRSGAMAFLFGLLSMCIILALAGAAAGHWGWMSPGIIAIVAMITLWLPTASADDYAVGLWFVAASVVSFIVA